MDANHEDKAEVVRWGVNRKTLCLHFLEGGSRKGHHVVSNR